MSSVFSRDNSIAQIYFNLPATDYPGVYLTWERLTNNDFGLNVSPVSGESTLQRMYVIYRSPKINGFYAEIGRVELPDNEFIDEAGRPGYYYQIQLIEINLSSGVETIIATNMPMSGDELLINSSLAYEVSRFLDIPVRDEELRFNSDRTQAVLSYNNIVYTPRPEIRISANSQDGFNESYQIINEVTGMPYASLVKVDPTVDYVINTQYGTVAIESLHYQIKADGRIFFVGLYQGSFYPVSIPAYDTVLATYRVRMFSNTEMNDALYQALQYINARPGAPHFNKLRDTPVYYEPALITIATYYLLRRLLMRLSVRETRLLIGDIGDTPGNSYTAGVDLVKEMLTQYGTDMKDLAQNTAWAYYPGITSISGQTFQLPGSRSYMFRSMFFKDAGGYG